MQTLSEGWLLAPDPGNVGRSGRWFAGGPRPEAQPAPVPGIIQQVFPDYHGVAWYWCRFEPFPLPRPDLRWQIHFGGFVDYLAEVWLNGEYLGGYEGGEGPFDLDAHGALRPGDNWLAVRVLNPTNEPIDGYVLREVPHRNKVIPYIPGSGFNYGGIMLPVELRAVSPVRVIDLFARPDVRSGRVPVTVTLANDSGQTMPCRLSAAVGPANTEGPTAQASTEVELNLAPGRQSCELVLQVLRPRLWNLDDPYLYRVTVELQAGLDGAEHEDSYAVRCGFREFRVERGFFRLNGKRVFLRSTHTGNHVPFGQLAPVDPDLVRRDVLNAKAAGFNMVRFICGMAWPEQLDFCDELGLLVYEECMASWCLVDSPAMGERFDRNTGAMVRRDRNHPSVAVWGLLNETPDGAVFRHAVSYLPRLRELDDSRLVLLASGRWDCQWQIGSLANPGGTTWEHAWGGEAPDAEPAPYDWKLGYPGGYFRDAGDAHVYPRTPQTPETNRFMRSLGADSKPVFLSEYGIGSLLNVIRETRCFEQAGARADLFDVALMREWAGRLIADWQRWGFDGVYATPEDMLRDSQRLHVRQRLLGFDLIRANPRLCGYNLTGILDHGMTGEGLWSYNREWKPGIMDALCDGWAPVRWCLFVEPLHAYAGRQLRVEAVLANEDVLPPGVYPVLFRISGSDGVVWEQRVELCLPAAAPGEERPLATPALSTTVTLDGPAGAYEFRAYLERGGAPAGGRLKFYLAEAAPQITVQAPLVAWGLPAAAESWLAAHGATPDPFAVASAGQRQVILVGCPPEAESDLAHWTELARRLATGSTVIFLSPQGLARASADAPEPLGWLPLAVKGRCYQFNDWLYHKECVAKAGPPFAGLQAGGILDWDYYGPVIPHDLYDGQPAPDDIRAAAFAVSCTNREGYASGVLLGSYRFGAGRFTISTFPILENLDRHPTADRLLLGLVAYAAAGSGGPAVALPEDFADRLAGIGYVDQVAPAPDGSGAPR
jgi:hypothetical protein